MPFVTFPDYDATATSLSEQEYARAIDDAEKSKKEAKKLRDELDVLRKRGKTSAAQIEKLEQGIARAERKAEADARRAAQAAAAAGKAPQIGPLGYALGGAAVGGVAASFAGYSPVVGGLAGAVAGYFVGPMFGPKVP